MRNKEQALQDGITIQGSSDDDRNHIHTGPQFGCVHWQEQPGTQINLQEVYKKLVADGGASTGAPRWDWNGSEWVRMP